MTYPPVVPLSQRESGLLIAVGFGLGKRAGCGAVKWLTGFDVPSCSTIYLDKPMKNHYLEIGEHVYWAIPPKQLCRTLIELGQHERQNCPGKAG